MALGHKTGGRKAGTPNKRNSPIKELLRTHSLRYWQPSSTVDSEEQAEELGLDVGDAVSQFDLDVSQMDPVERARLEVSILPFHTPKMKESTIDMNVADATRQSLIDRLKQLATDKSNTT